MAVAVAAMAGIGGLVLLNLGIVGAYLGRAAREAKERPMYFVSEGRNIPTSGLDASAAGGFA